MGMELFIWLDRAEQQAKAIQASAVKAALRKPEEIQRTMTKMLNTMQMNAFDKFGASALSAAVDAVMTAAPAIGLAFGVPGAKFSYFADVRKLVHKLEYVILMATVYEFLRRQLINFRGLDQALRENQSLMVDMMSRVPKLREALVTIVMNLNYDEAADFVNKMKAKVPKEFWDMSWSIKA